MNNFSNIITTGLNNPDCSFFVGIWMGQFFALKYLIVLFMIYIAFKLIYNFIINPFINKIKSIILKKYDRKSGSVCI